VSEPQTLYLTEDVRRSIKAEAHKLWFDAFNPYCERVGVIPETEIYGDEAATVRDYIRQLMEPVLDNHQRAVKEIERLRAELAARPARLNVVKPDG